MSCARGGLLANLRGGSGVGLGLGVRSGWCEGRRTTQRAEEGRRRRGDSRRRVGDKQSKQGETLRRRVVAPLLVAPGQQAGAGLRLVARARRGITSWPQARPLLAGNRGGGARAALPFWLHCRWPADSSPHVGTTSPVQSVLERCCARAAALLARPPPDDGRIALNWKRRATQSWRLGWQISPAGDRAHRIEPLTSSGEQPSPSCLWLAHSLVSPCFLFPALLNIGLWRLIRAEVTMALSSCLDRNPCCPRLVHLLNSPSSTELQYFGFQKTTARLPFSNDVAAPCGPLHSKD